MGNLCCRRSPLLILCVVLFAANPCPADEWTFTRVIDGMVLGQLSPDSMRMLDSTTPALAFAGDKVYYATYDTTAGTWSNARVIEENPDTSPPALAFNTSSALPVIAYYDRMARVLKMARKVRINPFVFDWMIETVGPSSAGYDSPSVAVDSGGNLHVAYITQAGNLVYAYKDGGGWHFDHPIAPSAEYIGKPSLALTSTGQPYIAYTDLAYNSLYQPSGAVKIASRNCSPGTTPCSWAVETIGSVTVNDTLFAQLIIDSADQPHVFWLYTGADLTSLRRATRMHGSWQTEIFDTWLSARNSSFSAAQDSSGDFHFLCYEYQNDRLVYKKSTEGWKIIRSSQEGPTTAAMVLNGGTTPFVAFTSPHATSGIHQLQTAIPAGAEWLVETAWTGSFFPNNNLHLDTDSDGHPHIAYYDSYAKELRWSEYTGSNWVDRRIKSSIAPGYTAFSLGPTDWPNIAYTDRDAYSAAKLLRASCNDLFCLWEWETVHAAGAWEIQLAVDGNNKPHLSYGTSAGIVYAYRGDTAWLYEDPIPGSQYTCSSSLAISPANLPQIAYKLLVNGDVYFRKQLCMHAFCWWNAIGPVNDTAREGYNVILRVDSNSNPHMVTDQLYTENDGIDYFWQNAGVWDRRRLYQRNPSYLDFSFYDNYDFALAPGDVPHFIVSGQTTDTLYSLNYTTAFKHNNMVFWYTTTIRNFAYSVKPRLKVDKWGQPHIIYVDKGNDLIHAVKKNQFRVFSSVAPANGGSALCAPNPVDPGGIVQCTLTPSQGFFLSGTSGSCPGTLVGNTFTTEPLAANCALVAGFHQPGDVDQSGTIDLADAILSLQLLAGSNPATPVFREADTNSDGKIGMAEVLKILGEVAQ